MLPLLQLLLPEVAADHRVEVLVDALNEVLTAHADLSLSSLQVALVDTIPLLHRPLFASTSALAVVGRPWQWVSAPSDASAAESPQNPSPQS